MYRVELGIGIHIYTYTCMRIKHRLYIINVHTHIYIIIYTLYLYTRQGLLYIACNQIWSCVSRPLCHVLDSSPDHWKTSKFAELCSTHYVCWSTNQTWPLQVQNAPNIVSHSFDLPGTSWRSPGKLLERLAAVAAAYQSLGDTSSRNALRHLGCC